MKKKGVGGGGGGYSLKLKERICPQREPVLSFKNSSCFGSDNWILSFKSSPYMVQKQNILGQIKINLCASDYMDF